MMLNPIAQILQDMRHFIIDPVNPRGWDIINNKLIAFVPYAIPVVILSLVSLSLIEMLNDLRRFYNVK